MSATAYTPGLKVTEAAWVHKERRLPLKGEVVVRQGEAVTAGTVVARTFLPGAVQLINVANRLGVEPSQLPSVARKHEGDAVAKDEVLAESKGMFGLFKNAVTAPVAGTIETVSHVTGQIILREAPSPVEIAAYVDGVVQEVLPDEGVIVRTYGSFIQGIFGIGGEISGELAVAVADPGEPLTVDRMTPDLAGKIVVGGSFVTSAVLKAAVKAGVAAIIAGGIDDQDLRDFLGYDLGVAITGSEDLGITLVITEGFGEIRMAEKTFRLLSSRAGQRASVNGATQIRAGVIRPEVIVPLPAAQWPAEEREDHAAAMGMSPGSPIRIIREPDFGKLASVISLPVDLHDLPTEAKVRVVEVELADGRRMVLPRANVELIET